MSELLVLAEHDRGKPRKIVAQILTKAREIAQATDQTVSAVAVGMGAAETAEALGRFGAQKLYVWDDSAATYFVTLPLVEVVEHIFPETGANTILFPSTNFMKDVAARLAIRLGAGIITDAVNLELMDGHVAATKHAFGGAAITRCYVEPERAALVGVSPNAFPAEEVAGQLPEIVEVEFQVSEAAAKTKMVETVTEREGGRPEIAEAAMVVAGGRGLGDASGFDLLGELADVLGAGLGASRAAADAGWIPHRHQIGQTGKTISPQLYLGCGISGAIQHRAGMQTSQLIAVINKDPEAPIFQIADFGVVGDLYKVVPKLIEEIRKRKGA